MVSPPQLPDLDRASVL